MVVTLSSKTLIPASVGIAALALTFSIAFYMGGLDRATEQDRHTQDRFEQELDRIHTEMSAAVESVRGDLRASVDELRKEMRELMRPMATRDDVANWIENARRAAALEIQLPLLQRLGELEGRVKSLEDNGQRRQED